MRELLFIFILFSSTGLFGQNANHSEILKAAHETYLNEEFEDAVALYESLRTMGLEAPELYYNLGNAYFRLGMMGKAIVNYERSLRLNPRNEDALFNLQVALARTTDTIIPAPQLFYYIWWQNFTGLMGMDAWAVLTLVLLFLFLLSIATFIAISELRFKKSFFVISLILLVVFVASFAATHSKYHDLHHKNEAVLILPRATGKSAPSTYSSEVFVIHEGNKGRILEELNGWYEIKLSNGTVGWVQATMVEII